MPRSRWTDDEIAKLKSLAGKLPAKDIAAELGRSPGSLAVRASKLKITLRCNRNGRRVWAANRSHAQSSTGEANAPRE